ncbi:MAG: hypothetical protein Q8K63_00335 [Acidimicrobiales bacterium]|nr:hypothetical protein [Acidimicrobiales bacterium]
MLVNGNRRVLRGLAIALAAAALAAGSTSALAQTTTTPPYPGNPTTTAVPGSTDTTINLGARGLGSRFSVSRCGWLPLSTVTNRVNSTPVGNTQAQANGCDQITYFIRPALAQALRLDQVGSMLAVTGLAAKGDVEVEVNGQVVQVGPLGSVVSTVSNGTGANGQPRTVTVNFTVLRANQVDGSGGLARTGSAILKWSPLGAGLVAVGYMLVLVTRRRRAAIS